MNKKISSIFGNNFIATVIISYLSIVAIMLTVLFCSLSIYGRYYVRENESYNNYVFRNITVASNNVIRDMNNVKVSVLSNDRIVKLLNDVSGDIYLNEEVYDVVKELKEIVSLNENIDLCYIYIRNIDSVLYSGGIVESRVFYEMWIDEEKMSYKKWKSSMENNEEYTLISGREDDGQKTEFLLQRFKIPVHGDNLAFIMSNKNNMMSFIDKNDRKKGYKIYIFNPYGRLVVTNVSNEERLPASVIDIIKNSDDETVVFQNERIIDNNKWQTVVTVPRAEILSKVRMLRYIVAAILIFGILLLFALIAFFVKRSFNPVKKVFDLLGMTENEQQFGAVYEKVDEILKQNKFLVKGTEINKKSALNIYLTSLLKGTYYNSKVDFEFSGKKFHVIMFEIEMISEFFSDTKLNEDEKHYHLYYVIENVLTEKLNEIGIKTYFLPIDNRFVCITNSTDIINEENLFHLTEKGVNFINDNFNVNVFFSVSIQCDSEQGLVKAYNQSSEVMDYISFYKLNIPMNYHTYVENLDSNELIFNKKVFYNFLKNGYKQNSCETVEALFNHIMTEKNLPVSQVKFTAMQIAEICQNFENTQSFNEVFVVNKGSRYKEIRDAKDINSVKKYLIEYSAKICDKTLSELDKARRRNHVNVGDILKYIRENYSNQNLNVNAVAYYFEITPSYLTKVFKKEVNTSMLDYINHLRIEHVSKLMMSGTVKLEQAIEMSGFSNERTYFRVKKKLKDMDVITINTIENSD